MGSKIHTRIRKYGSVWRNEVIDLSLRTVLDADIETYLEYCPIRPHERLKMPTYRFVEILKKLAPTTAILISSSGDVKNTPISSYPRQNARSGHPFVRLNH